MDDKTGTAYNALKSMLFDGTKDPMQLPLSLLKAITNDFTEEREVGSGGFAVVYKGRVGDEWVAVKKLSATVDMDEKKFTKEIQCLMKLRQHTNIVRFLGYCADTQGEMVDCNGTSVLADRRNRLLCFEFVPKGTLRDYIDGAYGGLEWQVAYQIIKGICKGLHYLHEKNIVHSDLKPGNILLDDKMLPKIADFGLSRCFDENQSKAITSKLFGTSGYLPQEFFDGDITLKLDIYSLGVIINEILTGKKSSSTEESVLKSWSNRLEISEREILLQQVRVCSEIAKMCVDHNRENRPTASDIIKKFEELGSSDNFDEAGARTSLAQGKFNIDGNGMTLTVKRVSNQTIATILKFTDVIEFSYGDIRRATGNFGNVLGQGGFGNVYKGNFKINGNDIILAVKCVTHQSGAKQLLDELKMLTKLEHVNVVRLVGFCRNDGWFRFGKRGKGFYICNEYFSNGSLDAHIFGNNQHEPLKWSTRYKIIRGICAGLLYLHELCNHTICHMDLKPSNILLDLHMTPKIADFGLSIMIGKSETHTYTTEIIGTNGYMAPEYLEKGRVGCECDIYSLGILIMAIVMGRGPQDLRDPSGVVFIREVRQKFTEERHSPQWMREASWLDDDCLDEVEKCIGLAFECVEEDPDKRPQATYIYSRLPAVVDNNTTTSYY